jgi:hypothetical protein
VETKAHLCFFKKGRGALWLCLWNQGGGGPKKFGNYCSRVLVREISCPLVCNCGNTAAVGRWWCRQQLWPRQWRRRSCLCAVSDVCQPKMHKAEVQYAVRLILFIVIRLHINVIPSFFITVNGWSPYCVIYECSKEYNISRRFVFTECSLVVEVFAWLPIWNADISEVHSDILG